MRIIEIAALPNGAHRNQTGSFSRIPDGWAKVPSDMDLENFPFGDLTVAEINYEMTVTSWTPGTIPEPTPAPITDPSPTVEERLTNLETSNAEMSEALDLLISGVTE